MTKFDPKTILSAHQATKQQLRLPLLIAFASLVLVAALPTRSVNATVQVNGSGTLLGKAPSIDTTTAAAALGAVTMASSDVAAAPYASQVTTEPVSRSPFVGFAETNYYPQATSASFDFSSTSVRVGSAESHAFGDVTPVPEPSTWLAGLLAGAFTLFVGRTRMSRRLAVRVENTK